MTTAEIPKLVGTRVKRREDPRLITGNATYCDDIQLPGMLFMSVLRSPYANARITRIDASQARAMRGVQSVLTGAEIKEECVYLHISGSVAGYNISISWRHE